MNYKWGKIKSWKFLKEIKCRHGVYQYMSQNEEPNVDFRHQY